MDDKKKADHGCGRLDQAGGRPKKSVNSIVHVDTNLSNATEYPPFIVTDFEGRDNYEPTSEELDWLASELSPTNEPTPPTDDITRIILSQKDLDHGQYLPKTLLSSYLGDKVFIGVKSPIGTGKTRSVICEALEYAQQQGLTFGYTAHLQNLVKNACYTLGVIPHTDFDSLDRVMDKPILGFCTNGIPNKMWQPDNETDFYDVLILDEIKQQVEAIMTGTVKHKKRTLDALLNQISKAKVVICLDADLEHDLFMSLSAPFDGQKIFIHNPLKNWQDRQLIMTNIARLVALAHATLVDNGKLLIPCASKERAKSLKRMFEDAYPNKKVWLVSQETAKEHSDFLNNPNKALTDNKPDVIIHTTVIGSGFSIDLKGYFDTCLLFGGKNLTVDATYQLIGRYRHWSKFYCAMPKSGFFANKTHEDYLNEIVGKAQMEVEALEYSTAKVNPDDPFYGLYADIRVQQNESKRNLLENFIAKGKAKGCSVDFDDADLEQEKAVKQQLKVSQVEQEKLEAQKVVQLHSTDPMTDKEAKEYQTAKVVRGGDDYYRYRGYEYQAFYGELPTVEGLLEDDFGNRQEQIKRYEAILKPRATIVSEALNNLDDATYKGELDATMVRGVLSHYDLIHELLKAIGVGVAGGELDASQAIKFDKQTLLDSDLMTFIENNRQAINNGALGFTVTDNTLENPVKFIGLALGTVGLKLISKRSGATRYKAIDTASLEKLNEVTRCRNASLGAENIIAIEDEVTRIDHECDHKPIHEVELDGVVYMACGCGRNAHSKIVNTGGGKVETETKTEPEPIPTQANF